MVENLNTPNEKERTSELSIQDRLRGVGKMAVGAVVAGNGFGTGMMAEQMGHANFVTNGISTVTILTGVYIAYKGGREFMETHHGEQWRRLKARINDEDSEII